MQSLTLLCVAGVIIGAKGHWDDDQRKKLGKKDFSKRNGTYILGGLFAANVNLDGFKCSPKFNIPGILYIQAMMYAIDEVNKNETDWSLGYHIVNDCYGIDRAMEASMEFLMGPDPQSRWAWLEGLRSRRGGVASPVVGVVGAANSDISTAVASLLSVNSLPQISYSATSPELSDKTRYPAFLRTIPPDDDQVLAISDLIAHFGWSWISLIAIDNSYGRFGLQGLKGVLHKQKICLAAEILADPNNLDDALDRLQKASLQDRANVVVLIWPGVDTVSFFQKVAERNIVNKTWIASESWGYRAFTLNASISEVMIGAIGVSPWTRPREEDCFFNFFRDKLLFANANQWLQSFLNKGLVDSEHWTSNSTGFVHDHPGFRTLSEGDLHTLKTWFSETPQVIKAVRAFAAGIRSLRATEPDFLPSRLLHALHNVPFNIASGSCGWGSNVEAQFDVKGNVVGSYSVTNLQSTMRTGGNLVTLQFAQVGFWNGSGMDASVKSRLRLNESLIQWKMRERPVSSCHSECAAGWYKIYGSQRCCWKCSQCPVGEFTNGSGETECVKCAANMTSNDARTACVFVTFYVDAKSAGEIIALIFAGIGIVVDLVIMGILVYYRKTPVVVCSNRPLTLSMLAILGLAFTLPFIFLAHPTPVICGFEAVLLGAVFSTITAIFLVKTRHVWKIFTAKLSDTLYMVNQRGLQRRELWQSGGLAVVGVVMLVPFLATTPPEPTPYSADCGSHWVTAQIISMSYIAALSFLATYAALKARRLPENYNEAGSIATTMLLLLLVWASSLPAYFRVPPQQRVLIVSLAVDAAGAFILLLVFVPKVYIIFMEPEKNTLVYVSRMNMIHIWKQQSRSDRKARRRHRAERRAKEAAEEVAPAWTHASDLPSSAESPSSPQLVTFTTRPLN